MKFIDLFAGIGGFRSGLEKAGHQCIGYIEWDKFARQSYEAIYDTDGEFTAHDIQEVKGEQLPNAELWTFGSPCTNISIAGNRIGIRGGQSRMFFEVIRLLKERIENKETLPSYLIMENVKNLLSSNQGRDFAEVIYQMGHLRKGCIRQVFPIQRQGKNSAQSAKIKVMGNTGKTGYQSHDVLDPNGISKTLTATDYKHPQQVAIHQVGNYLKTDSFGGNPQVGRVYGSDGIAPTLNTMQGDGREPKILVKACLTPNRIKKRQNGRRFKQNGEPAFTLTAADRNGILIDDGTSIAIRKLTPLECWRLQGFTDEQFSRAKQAGISNSQLYKQAGNAVTVPVVKAIGQSNFF